MTAPPDRVTAALTPLGRVTAARWWILHTLWQAPHPLSPDEVGQAIAASAPHVPDRVTIYRTLEWLVSQGLARRIAASDRAARFEAVTDEPAHTHFLCQRCGQTWCLPAHTAPWPKLPDGFLAHHAELVIHGLCAGCCQNGSPDAAAANPENG